MTIEHSSYDRLIEELEALADVIIATDGKSVRMEASAAMTRAAKALSTIRTSLHDASTPLERSQPARPEVTDYAATMSVVRNSGLPVCIIRDLESMYDALGHKGEPDGFIDERTGQFFSNDLKDATGLTPVWFRPCLQEVTDQMVASAGKAYASAKDEWARHPEAPLSMLPSPMRAAITAAIKQARQDSLGA